MSSALDVLQVKEKKMARFDFCVEHRSTCPKAGLKFNDPVNQKANVFSRRARAAVKRLFPVLPVTRGADPGIYRVPECCAASVTLSLTAN